MDEYEELVKIGKRKDYILNYQKNNPEKYRLATKKYTQKLRMIVINHYCDNDPKCACCGECILGFLTIDHIKQDGYKHRKSLGGNAQKLYLWIIKNNFPDDFQILCMNCNWGRRYTGICPHLS